LEEDTHAGNAQCFGGVIAQQRSDRSLEEEEVGVAAGVGHRFAHASEIVAHCFQHRFGRAHAGAVDEGLPVVGVPGGLFGVLGQEPELQAGLGDHLFVGVLRGDRHVNPEVLTQPDAQTGERRNVTAGTERFDHDPRHDSALVASSNMVTSSSPYPTTS
jgi:hypothetical protein